MMHIVKVDNDGKNLTLTGTEGEVEAMVKEALYYGERYGLRMDYISCRMGHVYDDRDLEVQYA